MSSQYRSPVDLQVEAQKSAARVLGRAEALLAATRAVLAERERELLELKGPCSVADCRLHYAHAGPCDIKPAAPDA